MRSVRRIGGRLPVPVCDGDHSANAPMRENFCRRRRRRSIAGSDPRKSSSAETASASSSADLPWSRWAPPDGSATMASTTPRSRQARAVGRSAAAARLAWPASFQRIAAQPSGRDHAVDGVLLHQHAVGDADRQRAAGCALADHARHDRHRAGSSAAAASGRSCRLAARLGADARVARPGVSMNVTDRVAEPVRQLDRADRLAVALGAAPCRSCGTSARSGRGPSGARRTPPSRPWNEPDAGDDRRVVAARRGRRGARRSRRRSARGSRACTAGPGGARAGPRARSATPRRAPGSGAGSPAQSPTMLVPAGRGAAGAGAPGRPRAAAPRVGHHAACAGTAGRRPAAPAARATVSRSSGRGTTRSMWPWRRLDSARPKSSGSVSRGGLLDHARPGERHQRARLGDRDVAERGEAARSRRPSSGGAITEMNGTPASRSASTAATVFAICISARMSSCMRAPPEAATETSGTPWRAPGRRRARTSHRPPSPCCRPGSAKSITASATGRAADRGRADEHRVAQAGGQLGRAPAGPGTASVDELERVGREQVARRPR